LRLLFFDLAPQLLGPVGSCSGTCLLLLLLRHPVAACAAPSACNVANVSSTQACALMIKARAIVSCVGARTVLLLQIGLLTTACRGWSEELILRQS